MHTKSHLDTIRACRFCFMCRHLSPIGNVTFRECDTPRGRALMLDNVLGNPRLLELPDFIGTIFDADLSAACRFHCVSHYDESGLILAARRDIVEAGQAPAAVQTLARNLAGAEVVSRGDSAAEVVYFVDPYTTLHQPEIAAAMEDILKAAGVPYQIVSGADSGKALKVLGYWEEARMLATKISNTLTASPAKILVTSCPAAYDAFRNDYPAFGVALGKGIEILHSSELFLRLVKSGRMRCRPAAGLKVFPLASDYLKNYNDGFDGVERLLEATGVETEVFGFNCEESYTAGEGAVVLDQLNSRLVEKLSRHVVERIRDPKNDVLLVASPYTKYALLKFGGKTIRVVTVEEIVRNLIHH
jgi:Fe-S oxidoreductase